MQQCWTILHRYLFVKFSMKMSNFKKITYYIEYLHIIDNRKNIEREHGASWVQHLARFLTCIQVSHDVNKRIIITSTKKSLFFKCEVAVFKITTKFNSPGSFRCFSHLSTLIFHCCHFTMSSNPFYEHFFWSCFNRQGAWHWWEIRITSFTVIPIDTCCFFMPRVGRNFRVVETMLL